MTPYSMLSRLTRGLLMLGSIVVVALLALNLYIDLKPVPKPQISQPLASLMPLAPLGWTAQDLPIASTPEAQARVDAILHYDDAAFRIYDNGNAQVSVYVAHWLPGEFSPAKVGAHTPDTCWVDAGWVRTARQQAVTRQLSGADLKPLEFGVYEKDGTSLNVIFWHLLGGNPVRYDLTGWENGLAGRIQRFHTLVEDFANFGLDQRQEQLLVRISSNVPFDQLMDDPGFVQIMSQMSREFGLYAKPPAAVAKIVGA
jgi:hypothetical protein